MIRNRYSLLCFFSATAFLLIASQSIAQENTDPGSCLPCLLGIERTHPIVSHFVDNYELKFVDIGYGDAPMPEVPFNFTYIYFEGDQVRSAGIELKHSTRLQVGDFQLNNHFSQFKKDNPHIFKKKFNKEIVPDVFKNDDLTITALIFEQEIFGKMRKLTLLINNYGSKIETEKTIHAVAIEGTDRYYHIPLCNNYFKSY